MGRSTIEIAHSPLAEFQQHLREGRLAYQFSPSTGTAVFFPRVAAPGSGARDLEWRVASGLGTVYATTAVFPREGDPYNVALIDLDEGFRLMSRVVGVAPDQVGIGQRVRVEVIGEAGQAALPYVFHPVSEPVA